MLITATFYADKHCGIRTAKQVATQALRIFDHGPVLIAIWVGMRPALRSLPPDITTDDDGYKPNDTPCLGSSLSPRSISSHRGPGHPRLPRSHYSFHYWSLSITFALMVTWSSAFVAATAVAVGQTGFALLPPTLADRQADPCAAIANQTYVVPSEVFSCLKCVPFPADRNPQ